MSNPTTTELSRTPAANVTVHGVTIDAETLNRLQTVSSSQGDRLFVFLTLYLTSAATAIGLQRTFGDAWGAYAYLACAPLYLLAAASLHGISLFTHEGVHGVLSLNPLWNRLLSVACALPVGQNFAAYKVLHLRHHKHLGMPGDPDHYDNYTRWTWLVFTMHWLRLLIGYPVYLVAIPLLGFRQGNLADRVWILIEVGLLVLLVTLVCLSPIPWTYVLHGWLLPMIVINTLVNIRGMSQHTFLENSADPVAGTRSILTNRVTTFFMCNENYHLEHHLFPRVPWYHLDELHRVVEAQLRERRAPFVPSYFAFVREFVASSWRRSPWGRSSGT